MAAARKSTMTAEHKRALAEGRAEGRAGASAYLEALDQNRPRRGRRRTPASIKKRLAAIEAELRRRRRRCSGSSSSRSAWTSSASSTGSTPPTTSPASSATS